LWRDFQNRVSRTISLGWLQTAILLILLISASWVARVTVRTHRHPAFSGFLRWKVRSLIWEISLHLAASYRFCYVMFLFLCCQRILNFS
jgi:hypothetical protein